MNILNSIRFIVIAGFVAAMGTGCGSGGGSGSTPGVSGGGNTLSTIVSGTASKGIIYPGTIYFYGIDATGVKSGTPITSVNTDEKGRYAADLGSYIGPLLVEASGDYTDEATGTKVTIAPTTPLHAVIDLVDNSTRNNRVIAVTPLTELAYGMADSLKPDSITAANQRVCGMFKLADIIGTEPVKADPAVMGAAGISTEQQAYTLALATLSQMANNAHTGSAASFDHIRSLVDSFKADAGISSTAGLGKGNSTAFASALASATSSPEMAKFSQPISSLSSVGSPMLQLRLAAANVPAGTKLGGLRATITLPPGASIPADAQGQVSDGLIVPTGAAAGGTAIAAGNYNQTASNLVVSLISSSASGFGDGDCAVITVNVLPGSTLKASDFAASINEAKDAGPNYGAVTGVTVSLK